MPPCNSKVSVKEYYYFDLNWVSKTLSPISVMKLKAEIDKASTTIKTAEMKLKHDTQVRLLEQDFFTS